MTTDVLTSGTTWTVPANVYSLTSVECWGGGAATGSRPGGGGGYGKIENYSVTPGQIINIQIAAQTSSTTGGDTWFATSGTVKGGGASGRLGGTGTGTTTYTGGNGRDATDGGGGSSATPTGNGGAGDASTGGSAPGGGAGGAADTNGTANVEGGGGGGPYGFTKAGDGGAPGGGGGGSGAGGTGLGARGQIRIIYTATVNSVQVRSVW